ncbi:MAG: modified peptide precursor CbpA [Burkholderiales bacterium]|nr:modified peptide precursor CbpA [Ferrovum sp.]
MTAKTTPQIQLPPKQCIPQQPTVIALRKRCEAKGVGLSHYILVDLKAAK